LRPRRLFGEQPAEGGVRAVPIAAWTGGWVFATIRKTYRFKD
jgi:hypothetical protein